MVKTIGIFFKRLLLGSVFLLFALTITAFLLLTTERGFKKIPTMINHLTPFKLHCDAISGHLFARQIWRNCSFSGAGLNLHSDQFIIDSAVSFEAKRFHVRELSATALEIDLPESPKNDDTPSAPLPKQLPEIQLPLIIDIDRLAIEQLNVKQSGKNLLALDTFSAELHGAGSRITLKTALQADQLLPESELPPAQLNVHGALDLTGDYPLDIAADAQLDFPQQKQTVQLAITGSALRPHVKLVAEGALKAELKTQAIVELAKQHLDLNSNWTVFYAPDAVAIKEGSAQLVGAFDDLNLNVKTAVTGKNIPAADLELSAQLAPDAVRMLDAVVHTLGGSARLTGDVHTAPFSWQTHLAFDHIDARQYNQNLDLKLEGSISSEGKQTEEGISAQLQLQNLFGHWQKYPINGSGRVELLGKELKVDQFKLNFADNLITANGFARPERADLSLKIDARALEKLAADLGGAIAVDAHLGGSLDNPQLKGAVQWQKLRWQKSINAEGTLDFDGDLKQGIAVKSAGKMAGESIPETRFQAQTQLTQNAAEKIALTVHTLDGTAQLNGRLNYQPTLDWSFDGALSHLNLQKLLPEFSSQISAEFHTKGSKNAEELLAALALKKLDGHWLGERLKGEMQIKSAQNGVAIDKADIFIGDNHFVADGNVNAQKIDVNLLIDGKKLAALYPKISGQLYAQAKLNGTLQAPHLQAKISGERLAYQEYKLGALSMQTDSALTTGGAFKNHIELKGIDVADQQWSALRLTTNGSYDAHRVTLQSEGGNYNPSLQAKGGFIGRDRWAGKLEQLTLTGTDLHWQLRRPSAIDIAAEKLSIEDLCLADAFSALCVTAKKAATMAVDYRIEKLDPKSFQAFIPKNITLETQLKGAGAVAIEANGALRGHSQLQLTAGKIQMILPDKPPLMINLKTATLESKMSATQVNNRLLLDLGDSGRVRAEALISQFSQPHIQGTLNLDIADVGTFRYLVPQISELTGRVKGDVSFSGAVAKPRVYGEIFLENGKVVVPEYATELKDIRLRISAQKSGDIDIKGNIGTPKGNLTADGVLRLQPLTMQLALSGKELLLANSKKIRLIASPNFDIRIRPDSGVAVRGNIAIPEAKIDIPDTSSATAISPDVVIVNQPVSEKNSEQKSPVALNIAVTLGDRVFFTGGKAKLRLIGKLDVVAEPNSALKGRGRIEVAQGKYELYGQEMDIRRGWITFSNDITNPVLDILVLREIEHVEAGARIHGSVQQMQLTLTSDPAMPDSAILSYLVFGRAPDAATDSTALLQTAAVLGTQGFFPEGIAEKTGLDVFELGIGGLKAGKYLLEDVYIGMQSDFFTSITKFLTRYQITDRLSVEASAQPLENAVDFSYEFETN